MAQTPKEENNWGTFNHILQLWINFSFSKFENWVVNWRNGWYETTKWESCSSECECRTLFLQAVFFSYGTTHALVTCVRHWTGETNVEHRKKLTQKYSKYMTSLDEFTCDHRMLVRSEDEHSKMSSYFKKRQQNSDESVFCFTQEPRSSRWRWWG